MFKITKDNVMDELIFNCTYCGEEQECYTDIVPIIHCLKCHKILEPSPYHMYNNQSYRVYHHFMIEK
jgi:hypothetical protein